MNQRAQIEGQVLGLPLPMVFFSFIGIFVTSASVLIFGEAIWNPVDLIARFETVWVVVLAMLLMTLATLSTNIAANVVAAANDISNVVPSRISFRMGGLITGIIGILMCPWKLIADPQGYIFLWLIAYSSLLGAVGGIMIADYFILRKGRLNTDDLYRSGGQYPKWNRAAWISLGISLSPNLPGFFYQVGILGEEHVSPIWIHLYDYAWFISFFLAMGLYAFLSRMTPRA